MANVLKLTKQDKTTHVVPITNKAFYLAWNKRVPTEQQIKVEEVDEKDIPENLPFIDETFVTPLEAVSENKALKDQIEELKKQLAARDVLQHGQPEQGVGRTGGDPATVTEGADKTGVNNPDNVVAPDQSQAAQDSAQSFAKTAAQVIEDINNATSADDVQKIIAGDTRKTVQDAAAKKIASFSK